MARAQLSPLTTLMLTRLADRAGLSPAAVMELAVHDLYTREIAEPLGLPSPESWEAPGEADEADEEGDDATEPDEPDEPGRARPAKGPPRNGGSQMTDPDALKARVLALAESMRLPFRSTDLSQTLAREGVFIDPRQIGKMLAAEGWPTAEETERGVRRWLPLDERPRRNFR